MSLTTRRIIFYALVVLFLVSGGGVLLYANGWRVDPETFAVRKTGGVYIESVPRDAEILLNGKAVRNASGLISSGTLVSGLLPRAYEVTVQKEGYATWRRVLAVEPSLVTKAEHIILVPEKSVAVPLPVPAVTIRVSGETLIASFADGRIALSGVRVPGTEFTAFTAGKGAAISYDENKGVYFFTSLPEAKSSLNLTTLFNNLKERALGLPGLVLPREVIAHPFDAKKAVVRTDHGLYVIDTERLSIVQVAGGGSTAVTAVLARSQSLAWAEYSAARNESALMTSDLILRTSSRLATTTGTIEKIGEEPSGGFLLLAQNGRLFSLPRSAKEPETIEEAAADFLSSPADQRFMVRLRDGSLENGAHIFVRRGGAVSFVELFEDGTVLGMPLGDAVMSMAYDPSRNLFYLLEGGALRSLEL
ncbi:MAG: PEGA domain-containing protein [Candidatus Liptonbacteria bacterium]|nr:PEGA domain-containing protein [Candidatus Liptonbacteria bacterium]